eukprot:TRINITY_DN213_c0_g2_i1.p1 TRINITY_DN213_c0_g2~~TRINITY_DN213_c0_g2_i1.p1  ORF type:complete len:201 (+),score=58.08 TRINITY_DN213_c0_g2_i1:65-604(+)
MSGVITIRLDQPPAAAVAAGPAAADANVVRDDGFTPLEVNDGAGRGQDDGDTLSLQEKLKDLQTDNEWLTSVATSLQKAGSPCASPPAVPANELARAAAEEQWDTHAGKILTGVKVHQMPAGELEECRRECVRRGCRAFHVLNGYAFIREGTAAECAAALTGPFPPAASYTMKEGVCGA